MGVGTTNKCNGDGSRKTWSNQLQETAWDHWAENSSRRHRAQHTPQHDPEENWASDIQLENSDEGCSLKLARENQAGITNQNSQRSKEMDKIVARKGTKSKAMTKD